MRVSLGSGASVAIAETAGGTEFQQHSAVYCRLLCPFQVARAAVTAAHIYRRKFGDGCVPCPDPKLDFVSTEG